MVATLASVQDVKDMMGPDVDATILASDPTITTYIEKSEGYVVAITGIDWVTGIASVNATIAEALSLAVASHAARNIIKYDMSGIGTDVAITMMNACERDFDKILKQLRDFDTNQNLRSVPT